MKGLAGAAHAAAAEAWAMLQLGHREEAAQRAREVLRLPHADPAWPPTLTARITLGVAVAEEAPEEAVEHLHRALALAREDGHLNNEAWCLNCLGVALRRMGRYEEALAGHRAAFVLLDEEPSGVIPVPRDAELPALLAGLDRVAVRPS